MDKRSEQLKVRLTKEEMKRLEAYAESKGYSKSEIIRDYIKRLPKPKLDGG
ncbi:MAG: ribbon-helix-helix protein, CopG family [Prochloraceae cyanobacterium]|nr:ribbon-helix-helix protein, CopG family [Prochloraceae cyanobacterium]